MLTRLPDGTTIRIRRIRPSDKPLLAVGFRQASPESIRRRFLVPKPRVTAAELAYLTEVDFIDHYALVAVTAHDASCLVGVGRWVRDPKDPTQAELAIIVGDPLQRKGLGTTLGLALTAAARRRGVHRFTATMLADNIPAHRMFARISDHMQLAADGYVHELAADLPEHPAPARRAA